MKITTKDHGLQGSNPKTRKRNLANIAHTAHGATSGRTGRYENGTHKKQASLPAFNLKARVSAKTGLFDHLEITAKHGNVIGEREEIDLFRHYVGAAPQELKVGNTSERYGRLFTVAPENGRKGLPLVVRSQPTVWKGKPLPAPPLSGKLNTKRFPVAENQFLCNIVSDLHLNPSRAVNLCPSLANKQAPSWEHAILNRRPERELTKGLDGKDNLIPVNMLEPARKYSVRNHLHAVYAGIRSELRRASAATDSLPMLGTLKNEDFSLRRIETYFEFFAPDAVALVKKLAPTLRVFHKHNREREHGLDIETVGNSPTITLFLSNGEAVRVYAKAADRIRFEVIHQPKKQNGLIPDGYCAPTLEACIEKLLFLRQKAAIRVNQVLAFLSEWAVETPQDRAGASRYASLWFQRLGFSEASERLLELLRVNGRILAGQYLPKEERNALRRAKEQELVFYDENAKAYFPASCGTALPISGHSLTNGNSDSTNPGHNTETQPVASVPKFPTPIRIVRERIGIPPSPPSGFQRVTKTKSPSETLAKKLALTFLSPYRKVPRREKPAHGEGIGKHVRAVLRQSKGRRLRTAN